jgi:lipopolysaccharide transport system ATP-binding protein
MHGGCGMKETLIRADGHTAPAPEALSADCLIQAGAVGKSYEMYRSAAARLGALFGRSSAQRTFDALTDVSFELHRGEALGVIGRNGAGKSTLLQILAGILQPSAGWVRIRGRVAALLELGSGFNPEFTGRENVYLNGAIMGFDKAALDERFDAIASFADIGPFLDQPVKHYSSGMFVRLAFAVQANLDPDVLIVDEALSVGDIFFQQKCMRRIRDLLDGGGGVLLVTHDLNTVSKLCSRALLLSEGRVYDYGSPKAVLEQYAALSHGSSVGETGSRCDSGAGRSVLQPVPATAPRHGSGQVKISGYAIRSGDSARNEFIPGERFEIDVEVVAVEDGFAPSVGFQIQDRFGHKACGTNTLMQSCSLPALAPGRRTLVTFDVGLMLGEGEYTLSLAVATNEPETVAVYDWVDQIASLRVIQPPGAVVNGFAYCPVTVSYSAES